MLTPVDIQQKKFHVGLGYDKKDVNTFFDSVGNYLFEHFSVYTFSLSVYYHAQER